MKTPMAINAQLPVLTEAKVDVTCKVEVVKTWG